MGKYVGIDLGTTFSVVAYIDEKGNPKIVPNKEGEQTTPSAVLFVKGKPVVGSSAKKKSISDPGNYEAFVKRHMGESSYSFTNNNGESFRPEEVSCMILSKLKKDAEDSMGDEIAGAVITVPAYFADPQRQATKVAAELAGLNVLEMINEPTAAAVAFGVSKDIDGKQTVLIYDLGGGTFDVSILTIDNSKINVIATNGDHQLGGYDIDKAICKYVIEEAAGEGFDIESDPKAMQSLMIEAENVKKELSFKEEAELCIYIKGEAYETTIDRETFEDSIAGGILDTTLSVMYRTVKEAGLTYDAIDKVLLVGGSTRIPAVRRMIEEETGIRPSSEVHPDEAVAIGAAFHAVDAAKRKAAVPDTAPGNYSAPTIDAEELPPVDKEYTFQDVTSHGIGILTQDPELGKTINSIILPKNTPIPAEFKAEYTTTVDYQEEIELQVTSGEFENPDYVTLIGNAIMKVRPRAYQVPIQVVVSCDRNAIIHVRAIDKDENVDLGEITINRSEHNMTEEEVRKASKRLHKMNIGD